MRLSVGNTLRACGLVLATGPLCFTAAAATYVDVEAERAAAQAAGGGSSSTGSTVSATASDPYGAQPTQAYPATSYGVTNAPTPTSGIAPESSAYPPPATATAAPAPILSPLPILPLRWQRHSTSMNQFYRELQPKNYQNLHHVR